MRFDKHFYATHTVTLPSLVVSNAYQHLLDFAADLAVTGKYEMADWVAEVLLAIDEHVEWEMDSPEKRDLRESIRMFTENSKPRLKERMAKSNGGTK